ncbi:alanine/ornithine racemase family PLP-dependent enzyme [Halanaerobium praevalens]|uniref:Alanine racemase domain protein n=1 Tax=Halanaerobium praevalens (strain ATCC 33744 / DSM 2228 / GSL) TaxID=572479 RepID=E3DP38_HALPG|nr:alanine/ornithine racemase family PLP-dependent enzyme [Halanaerobium praevalens]ADO77671.1 alanine racemase domain protein [Halanaerobium praevalens DSM 2228]
MKYPRIDIDLSKLKSNFTKLNTKCLEKKINLTVVTKGIAGDQKIIETFINSGVKSIADSRLDNIKKIRKLNYQGEIILLRIPKKTEINEAVDYIDYSLVTELESCKLLAKAANKKNKKIGVIVMVDIGDRREGVMPQDLTDFIQKIIKLPGLYLEGIGTNLGCYGCVIPDQANTKRIIALKNKVEKELAIKINRLSGGNTATTNLFGTGLLEAEINNLRIGEAILLANDVTNQRQIDYLEQDVFTIKAEIVELKEKPSLPKGSQGCNFSGDQIKFKDKGIVKRAILAIGSQDIDHSSLYPELKGIEILGSSSDHLLLDLSNCKENLKYGDVLKFKVGYSALLRAMTSPYVAKNYLTANEN